jgi:hypothetical protein
MNMRRIPIHRSVSLVMGGVPLGGRVNFLGYVCYLPPPHATVDGLEVYIFVVDWSDG